MYGYNKYLEVGIRVFEKYKAALPQEIKDKVEDHDSRFRISSKMSDLSENRSKNSHQKTILYYFNKEAEEKSMIKQNSLNNSSDSNDSEEFVPKKNRERKRGLSPMLKQN